MTEENKLKTRAIALIDAQEKFKEVNLEALENAVEKYRIALEAANPAKQEVLRIIDLIRNSCSELDNTIVEDLYEVVSRDHKLRKRYWNAVEWSDVNDKLKLVETRYSYEQEDLVDWTSSAC